MTRRPKELQRALGEGPLLQADPQRDLPSQVEVRSRLCLLIGCPFIGLQEQRRRQQARRNARATVVQTVEVGEVLVAEQLSLVHGKKAVEGVPTHVIEVGVLATTQV